MTPSRKQRRNWLSHIGVLLALCGLQGAPAANLQSDWLMKGHDRQRTGRSPVNGPLAPKPLWTKTINDGVSINMEPVVVGDRVVFGTWGLVRREKPGRVTFETDKCDGRLYALNIGTGNPLWEVHPGKTPYFVKPASGRERINYYNGTVEGTPVIDPEHDRLYFGRGDGKLYCLTLTTGEKVWEYATVNPSVTGDPETGGEIVGGPLITPRGDIVFGTFAAPTVPRPPHVVRHETNAVYCLSDTGHLRWRYPAQGSLDNPVAAPLAMSPAGDKIYAVTSMTDPRFDCQVLAFSALTGQLLWHLLLPSSGGQDLAVGSDGIIYVTGMRKRGFGIEPVSYAVRDQGTAGTCLWGPISMEQPARSQFGGGIAIYERDGRTETVYVSTTNLLEMPRPFGKLLALEPKSGAVMARWDPLTASPPCPGGLSDITLGNDEAVYVAVRGHGARKGRMYCLRRSGANFNVVWSHPVDAHLDWVSPAIGRDGTLYFGSSSLMPQFLLIVPRRKDENIRDADPAFYALRD